ncbi:MAG: acyl-CoA dehydrogenase family protein [Acidimicrobiales bacterium]
MSDLSEHHDELRRIARGLLGASSNRPLDWAQVAEVGWLGLEVPEALNGAGATFAETAVVLEEMGRAATTSPYLGSAVLGVGALQAVLPDPDLDDLLRALAAGERRVAVGLAPTGDQATVEPPFRVERTADGLRLTGRAQFVVDGTEADELIVLAVDPDGELVLVCVDATAVGVIDQPVLDATRRFATVTASGTSLSPSSVRSFAGDAATAAQHVLDRGAVAVACDSLGLGAAMLDATVTYVADRQQFGRAIGSFQAVKHQCADMLVQLTVGRELLDVAVEALSQPAGGPGPAAARAASFLSAAAVDVVGAAMQLHGGVGYSWESGIHVYLKRATLNRSLFGSPAAQRRRLSDELVGAPASLPGRAGGLRRG